MRRVNDRGMAIPYEGNSLLDSKSTGQSVLPHKEYTVTEGQKYQFRGGITFITTWL